LFLTTTGDNRSPLNSSAQADNLIDRGSNEKRHGFRILQLFIHTCS